MKKNITVIASVVLFTVGLLVFTYPMLSEWLNRQSTAEVVSDYIAASGQISSSDNERIMTAAQEYNRRIFEAGTALLNPGEIDGYTGILDISGTGIMGYLTIDKLNLKLPIYHGTDDGTLKAGVGHLEGSSLPVGGENTHSCLTAHSGLPGAELFTNLDRLDIGDRFTLTVLDRTLLYQVDSILVVTPTEFESLFVIDRMDYCTLITCTPYGVNSHRLLVRGVRIATGITS